MNFPPCRETPGFLVTLVENVQPCSYFPTFEPSTECEFHIAKTILIYTTSGTLFIFSLNKCSM